LPVTERLNFSIIVPTRDRAGPLAACLSALARLDYPGGDFEVIVVNDGSRPPDVETASEKDFPARRRWIHLPNNEGPAAARNCGASHARGRYLAFLDDDCLPAPDWLTQLQAALESAPGSAVGGRVVDGRPEDLCSAANQTILDFVYNYYNTDWRHAKFLASGNLAVPADLYRRAGGFNQDYLTSEDREFCARWLESGLGLVYAPEAVVAHYVAAGLGRFWRRHYDFGKGAYQFRGRHSKTSAGRIRLEPPAFYWRLLWAPFARGFSLHAVQLSLLVGLSQFASALGFLSARLKRHDSSGRSA
jgi:GT2 family glycosyltransferase